MTPSPQPASVPAQPAVSRLPVPPGGVNRNWPETDHSTLRLLRTGTPEERETALRGLFFTYAPPLRRYIRQHWPLLAEEDIEDLASEFATLCLTGENAHFLTYDPEREGAPVRLRTYLCRILDHFLCNRHRHSRAQARGGGRTFESLDTTRPAPHHESPAGVPHTTPGMDLSAYDRHWAQHILRLAFTALESGTAATREALPVLRPWILADPGESTLKELALRQGRTHAALRAQLHRLRKSWRQAVREAVAGTVSGPDEIDDELRHLAAVLSHHPPE